MLLLVFSNSFRTFVWYGTYDLSGRKVKHPSKGIYIRNGKKVALK